jgi:hypothetical protein
MNQKGVEKMGYISREDQKIAETLSHFVMYLNDKISNYENIDAIEKSTKFMRSIKMARTSRKEHRNERMP